MLEKHVRYKNNELIFHTDNALNNIDKAGLIMKLMTREYIFEQNKN